MQYIFTSHATWRMDRRHLTKDEVIYAVQYPDVTIKKHRKYYAVKNIGRGIIEVPYEMTERYIKIITVYWR